MIYIDKYAYFNALKDVHPAEKFAFAILTMLITVSSDSLIVPVAAFLCMSGAILFGARIPVLFYGKLLLLPLFFLAAGAGSVAIEMNSRNMLFDVTLFGNRLGISLYGLHLALKILMKSLGSVSCLYFLILTVPVTEILHILIKLKTPRLFVELLAIVYKYIFLVFETMSRIYVSQKSRLGYQSYGRGFRSLGRLAASTFIISLKRYEDMYNALESRCFTGQLHFYRRPYSFSKINAVFILVFDVSLLGMSLYFGGNP